MIQTVIMRSFVVKFALKQTLVPAMLRCHRPTQLHYRCFHSSGINFKSSLAASHQFEKPNPWALLRKVVTTSSTPSFRDRKEVSFDVGYIDTGAEWPTAKKETTPTVVAVHGSPATHTDVLPVVQPFHDLGYRVLAVNLPGYEITTGVTKSDNEVFTQSTTEIAEFLLDFLSSVHVSEVTMLVGHSGGTLPATILAVLSDIVKSVMFICPPPGHARPASAKPAWAIRAAVEAYRYKLGRMILRPLLPIVNKITIGLQSDRPSHLMNTMRYATNIEYVILRATAKNLNLKKVPTLYVCSENDSLIPFKLSLEWATMLGVSREFCDEYDSNFNVQAQALESFPANGYKKGVIFARGGHFPQFKKDTALPILISEAKHMLNIALHETRCLGN